MIYSSNSSSVVLDKWDHCKLNPCLKLVFSSSDRVMPSKALIQFSCRVTCFTHVAWHLVHTRFLWVCCNILNVVALTAKYSFHKMHHICNLELIITITFLFYNHQYKVLVSARKFKMLRRIPAQNSWTIGQNVGLNTNSDQNFISLLPVSFTASCKEFLVNILKIVYFMANFWMKQNLKALLSYHSRKQEEPDVIKLNDPECLYPNHTT